MFRFYQPTAAEFRRKGISRVSAKHIAGPEEPKAKEGLWEVAKGAKAKSRNHGRPRKYVPTQRIDRLIRTAYINFRKSGDRAVVHGVALRLDWPIHAVSRRARELGIAGVSQQRPWSRRELVMLKRGTLLGAETIRRKLRAEGFHRSISSILVEKRRAVISSKMHHSAREVALGFGIDPHNVLAWIRQGLLSAYRKNGSRWSISAAAIRSFIFAHPQQFDLAKTDKLWLLRLLECQSPKSIAKEL